MAGLMPLVVGGFTAGMSVVLPFGSLYSFTGFAPGVVLPWCLNMYDRRYGVSAGDKNSVRVKGYTGSVGYKYLYVLRETVRYLYVSSHLVISFECAVRLLGTAAVDLLVRVRLTPGVWCWQYVKVKTVPLIFV
jgi:hypothetical protein